MWLVCWWHHGGCGSGICWRLWFDFRAPIVAADGHYSLTIPQRNLIQIFPSAPRRSFDNDSYAVRLYNVDCSTNCTIRTSHACPVPWMPSIKQRSMLALPWHTFYCDVGGNARDCRSPALTNEPCTVTPRRLLQLAKRNPDNDNWRTSGSCFLFRLSSLMLKFKRIRCVGNGGLLFMT